MPTWWRKRKEGCVCVIHLPPSTEQQTEIFYHNFGGFFAFDHHASLNFSERELIKNVECFFFSYPGDSGFFLGERTSWKTPWWGQNKLAPFGLAFWCPHAFSRCSHVQCAFFRCRVWEKKIAYVLVPACSCVCAQIILIALLGVRVCDSLLYEPHLVLLFSGPTHQLFFPSLDLFLSLFWIDHIRNIMQTLSLVVTLYFFLCNWSRCGFAGMKWVLRGRGSAFIAQAQ